jgi:hypothetical protein
MNSDPTRTSTPTRRGPTAARSEDEDLEVGEPIPEENDPPPVPKIPGRRVGSTGKPPADEGGERRTDGQVVMATAKYMKNTADVPDGRKRDRGYRGGDSHQEDRSLEGRVLNGGVGGGLLAMAGAVVWFIAGLMGDVIFFYPPILFIIGLCSVMKGLAAGDSSRR